MVLMNVRPQLPLLAEGHVTAWAVVHLFGKRKFYNLSHIIQRTRMVVANVRHKLAGPAVATWAWLRGKD